MSGNDPKRTLVLRFLDPALIGTVSIRIAHCRHAKPQFGIIQTLPASSISMHGFSTRRVTTTRPQGWTEVRESRSLDIVVVS